MTLDTFEQTLLTELRHHVSARTPDTTPARVGGGRRWILGLTAGGVATAAAAAVVLNLGAGVVSPSTAYAVASQPDGDLVVTVYDLSDADGFEHALAAKGVRAEVSYVPDFSQSAGQSRSSAGSGDSCTIELAKIHAGLRFTLPAARIADGSELHIVTSGDDAKDVGSPVSVTWSGGSC